MFERLAKIRSVAQWLKAPPGKLVYSYPAYSNDNRPGFRRPDGRGLRPHQALACRWSLASGGRRLECRWELTAASGQSAGNRTGSPHLIGPPLVPDVGQMTALEQIAN
jgi:hypothetical protein